MRWREIGLWSASVVPLLLAFDVGGKRSPQLTVVLFIQLVHAAADPFQTMEKLMWKRTTTSLPR